MTLLIDHGNDPPMGDMGIVGTMIKCCVTRVLKLMEEKQLYEKTSKCFFGVQEVEYLGHIIYHKGVKVDPNKIKAIKEWKVPTTIKKLHEISWVNRALSQVC